MLILNEVEGMQRVGVSLCGLGPLCNMSDHCTCQNKENGMIVPKINFGRNCANFYYWQDSAKDAFLCQKSGTGSVATSYRVPTANSEFGCQK